MTKKNIILWIICLATADQIVKLIIANHFIDTRFDIIESVLGFHPIFNTKYSYVNGLFGLNLGLFPHAILLVFIQFLILFFYDYFKTIQRSTRLLDISFIFGQAALICVFCGFFFWKDGILDFIFLYLFTVDLKDIYLNCFALFLIWNYHKNKAEIQKSNLKTMTYLKKRWIEFKQRITK